jgi:hypothetical protein
LFACLKKERVACVSTCVSMCERAVLQVHERVCACMHACRGVHGYARVCAIMCMPGSVCTCVQAWQVATAIRSPTGQTFPKHTVFSQQHPGQPASQIPQGNTQAPGASPQSHAGSHTNVSSSFSLGAHRAPWTEGLSTTC